MRPPCSIPGCDNSNVARGWCRKHYTRWHQHGDPSRVKPPSNQHAGRDFEERFWEKVDKTDGCWLWTAMLVGGYGRIKVDGTHIGAHRIAYELLVDPIPEGRELHHTCGVRRCVNPAHLQPVTRAEHRWLTAAFHGPKAHCKRGHPFDDENTYISPNSGLRHCRQCRRDYDREWKRRQRERRRNAA